MCFSTQKQRKICFLVWSCRFVYDHYFSFFRWPIVSGMKEQFWMIPSPTTYSCFVYGPWSFIFSLAFILNLNPLHNIPRIIHMYIKPLRHQVPYYSRFPRKTNSKYKLSFRTSLPLLLLGVSLLFGYITGPHSGYIPCTSVSSYSRCNKHIPLPWRPSKWPEFLPALPFWVFFYRIFSGTDLSCVEGRAWRNSAESPPVAYSHFPTVHMHHLVRNRRIIPRNLNNDGFPIFPVSFVFVSHISRYALFRSPWMRRKSTVGISNCLLNVLAE